MAIININNKDIKNIFKTNIDKINFTGCSLDSRTIKKGNIFFAYKGKKNDGNQYIAEAKKNGAVLAIVERKNLKVKIPQIKVKNAHHSLIKLAKYSRLKSGAKIIAITGSVGKTSTKDALAHILKDEKKVFTARKSFNNIFGVPLEILNMPKNTKIGIFELGMNHKNELTKLVEILKPQIGLILNVNYVHGGNFNDLKDIAIAKAEIINSKFPVNTIILNKDCSHFKIINEKAKKIKIENIITHSFNKRANLMYCNHALKNSNLAVEVILNKEKIIKYKINSINDYLIGNTMAIIAILEAVGLNLNLIKNLKNLKLTEGRGDIIKFKKANKIIELHNHSYNSSPVSLFSSLSTFLKTSNKKNLIIIGDMNELGNKSEYYHLKVLKFLSKNKNDNHLIVGKIFYKYKDSFISKKINFYQNINQLNDKIFDFIGSYNKIFIKGSNSINLQKTINFVRNKSVE